MANSVAKKRNRRIRFNVFGSAARDSAGNPRTRAQKALFWAKIAGIVTLAGTAAVAILVASVFFYYGRDSQLPDIASLAKYEPSQVTRIVSSKGTAIGELYSERRSYIALDEVPKVVVQAFIAAEDGNFYEHQGVDYWGMLRAALINLRSGRTRQGASTITQQVVKSFLLSPERTLKRKVQEVILAKRLETALSKEKILTLYLNQIYFGHGRYGIQEAAQFYFGKDIREVNPGEAALLGGLPKGPERYSPRKPENRRRAKRRQHYVLSRMVHHGFIPQAEADKWMKQPIRLVANAFPSLGRAAEWVGIARGQLKEHFEPSQIDRLGGNVVTTLDFAVQKIAHRALRDGLEAHDARQKIGVPVVKLSSRQVRSYIDKLASELPPNGPAGGQFYEAVVLDVHDAEEEGEPAEIVVDLGNWKASIILDTERDLRFNPKEKQASEWFHKGDVFRVRRVAQKNARVPKRSKHEVRLAHGAEGAVVVMDPHTRRVLAVVGGYDVAPEGYNRATMAKRQPGSLFKPFVYAAAIDTGEFTAASVINDAPEVYDEWKPQNYRQGAFEGPVRLRYALAKSINTVAIRVLQRIRPSRAVDMARALGIESRLPRELSLALGSGEVSLLELTNAFATFAAGGKFANPIMVSDVLGEPFPAKEPVQSVRPEVAYIVVDMMRSVIEEGTGRRARALRMNVAGKTGTSNDARDAWFVGMSPDIVVGVWVGYDDNRSLGDHEGGGSTALPIYVDIMKAMRQRPGAAPSNKPFPKPPGIVTAMIDKKSGMLAAVNAGPDEQYEEVFIEGTVPTERVAAKGEDDSESFLLDQYDDGVGDSDNFADPGAP